MVTISSLYWRRGKLNIKISMNVFPREHEPAHFHAEEGADQATIAIQDGSILSGELDPSVYKEVYLWWERNKATLEDNWKKCRLSQRPDKIDGKVD